MTPSELQNRLHSDSHAFGTLIVSPSPRWPDALKNCGLDFVFIDTEHIALDREKLSWMCQTYASQGLPPLVRIPSPDPHAATTVLDGGAAGVIAPYVESVHQVKALRGAVKLRPIKGEKLEGILDGDPLEPTLKDYIKQRTADRLLIVNIESVPGINALDDILAIPDLDGVLIGPHDLSCNLGIPEQYDHPDFLEACKTIFHKARGANVGAGIHFWGDVQQHLRFLEMGANFLIQSADILLFQKYLSIELNAIRDAAEIKSDFPKRVKLDSI